MIEKDLQYIPRTALFAALAVVFPQLFHMLGLGSKFLPMFLPIFLGSLLLPMKFAIILACIGPLLSWLLTGMPPIFPPVLPVMLAELIVSSILLSWLHVYRKVSLWVALPIAVIADRLVLFLLVTLIAPIFGLEHPFFRVALVVSGIPGIVMLFITIPLAMRLIENKFPQFLNRNRDELYA